MKGKYSSILSAPTMIGSTAIIVSFTVVSLVVSMMSTGLLFAQDAIKKMKILFNDKSFMYFSRKLNLAFEYFISKKTLKSVVQGKKVSKPIVRISIISIALAMIVNLITIAVVTGFQQEVRQKVSGFGAHLFIMSAGENTVFESESIHIDQSFIPSIQSNPNVLSIYPVGYKPVLFQSRKNEVSYQLENGEDTTEVQQDVLGAVLKGVDDQYNWDFFKENLEEGQIEDFTNSSHENPIIISRKLSNDLHYELNDTVTAFFVKSQPVRKSYVVVGIYSTGLEEFDKKIVLGKLKQVQELNDWGIKANITVDDTLQDGQIIIRGKVNGGNGNYRYDWGNGYERYSGFVICPQKDTLIRLIASDYMIDIASDEESIPDTSYLQIRVEQEFPCYCSFPMNDFDELDRTYLNEDGSKYSITSKEKTLTFEETEGVGSSKNYAGGFEVILKDWENLEDELKKVRHQIDFIPNEFDEILMTKSIKDNQREIFVWLDFLDINVVIILVLMIMIGIINMGSALLVLILIRSNFIGMMKAMGATNWSIRKIFLIQAAFLISRGMFWGNLIGLAICYAQSYFGIFKLNAEVYYLSEVPIELTFMHWLLLNIGTLVICLLALILPSIVITRINPVKAIKFD